MPLLRVSLLAALAGLTMAQDALFGAMELLPDGVSPRFYANVPQLAKRDGAPCNPGHHRCVDIGEYGQCCSNNHYCYINPAGEPKCCAIGSNCDSNCAATAFQCATVVTASGTTSTGSACCGRSCPGTSMFQCESDLGGNCCGYGSTCGSDNRCRSTRTSASAIVTAIDPGCTSTDQHACPDEEGCCLNWMHCTTVSGQAACAPGNSENGFSFTPEPTSGHSNGDGGGLSTGAKAGIGAGVAVVACAIIGAIGWFCLIKRRRAREPTEGSSSSQRRSQQAPPPRPLGSDRSPAAMSEVTSEITRTSRLRGLTQDYFGPAAVPGPYTDLPTSAATSPGTLRGVPVMAHSPNDITAPVEIDSRLQDKNAAVATVTDRPAHPPPPETMDGRFELHGMDAPASPQSPSYPPPVADSPTVYPGDAYMRPMR